MKSIADGGSASSPFGRYAAWYDAFNQAKDYAGEVQYLLERVRSWRPAPATWLDVGCGTGHHVALLRSLGVAAEGVDRSPSMIAQARAAHPEVPFHLAPAQHFTLPGNRDVVSMLFHAMSYQVSDRMVRGAIENIAAHLPPDGLFLFDFWHSEAVRRDPPVARVREAAIEGRTLCRVTYPIEDCERRVIDVRFEFRWDSPAGVLLHEESHAMRYFDLAELGGFLEDAGFAVMASYAWMQDRPLEPDDWYGFICAQKRASG